MKQFDVSTRTDKRLFGFASSKYKNKCVSCENKDDSSCIFWVDNYGINLCNNCTFLLQSLIRHYKDNSNLPNNKIGLHIELDKESNLIDLSFLSYSIRMTQKQLDYLYEKLNGYNRYVYENKQLIVKNPTKQMKKIIEEWDKQITAAKDEFAYLESLDEIHRNIYFINKRIANKLECADNKPHELEFPNTLAATKITRTLFYCCYIPDCQCSVCHNEISSVIIFNQRDDDFFLALCLTDLHKLAMLLFEFYLDNSLEYLSCDKIFIKKLSFDSECFFCRDGKGEIYYIDINGYGIKFCKRCLKNFTYDVFNLSVFKEIYLKDYCRFQKEYKKRQKESFAKSQEYFDDIKKDISEQRKALRKERTEFDILQSRFYSEKYEWETKYHLGEKTIFQICDTLKKKNNELKNKVLQLEQEKAEQKAKEELREIEENNNIRKLSERMNNLVLQCQSRRELTILNYKKEDALRFPFTFFSLYQLPNVPAYTLKHDNLEMSDAIIYIKRPQEKLYLSLTENDIILLISDFKSCNKMIPQRINDEYNFSIQFYKDFSLGEHCYCCGRDYGRNYDLRFGNRQIKVCESCKERMTTQFSVIKQNIIDKKNK